MRREVRRKVIGRAKALTELARGQPDLVGALRKRRRAGRSERLRARAVKRRFMPEKASRRSATGHALRLEMMILWQDVDS